MTDVLAGGVRFHVQRLAARRPEEDRPQHPAVFIHGLGMDNLASFYYTLANPVARAGTEAILYDLRGHGLSERPPAGYSVADSVTDLDAILEALDVPGPIHLVGNSYGGMVALGFAIAYPARVASLLLIEAHFTVAGWAAQLETRRAELSARDTRTPWARSPGRRLARALETADDLVNRTTFLADLLRVVDPIDLDRLSTLDRPVRAVYGEDSDVLPYGRRLADLLPRCDLTVVPGHGHTVLLDAAPELREIALRWFAAPTHVPGVASAPVERERIP